MNLLQQCLADNGSTREVHLVNDQGEQTSSWDAILCNARTEAEQLTSAGLLPGMIVAVAGRASLALITTVVALWHLGCCPLLVPTTRRGLPGPILFPTVVDELAKIPISLAIGDPNLVPILETVHSCVLSFDCGAKQRPRTPPGEPHFMRSYEQPVFLQMTSGTTAHPKVVAVPQQAFLRCIQDMSAGMQVDPAADRICSWLPLYHDMGFIGMFSLALITGASLCLIDVDSYVSDPGIWHRKIAERGSTITCAPNFAYEIAARYLTQESHLDLRSLRIALNGAEMVLGSTISSYQESGARLGLREHVMMPVYGLAEATLGVTFSHPGKPPRYLAPQSGSSTRSGGCDESFVSVGRALGDTKLRISDADSGKRLPEGVIGEVRVRGIASKTFYLEEPAGRLVPTTDEEGWLRTGDLGFMLDGELALCGRLKDVIVIAGRNIYPEPVEAAVSRMAGVKPGRVVALSVWNQASKVERLYIGFEQSAGQFDEAAIVAKILHEFGVRPIVEVWPADSILKTSSGKVARGRCLNRLKADSTSTNRT